MQCLLVAWTALGLGALVLDLRGQVTHQSVAANTLYCSNSVQTFTVPAGTNLGASTVLSATLSPPQTMLASCVYTTTNAAQGPRFSATESSTNFSFSGAVSTGPNQVLWTLTSPTTVTGTLVVTSTRTTAPFAGGSGSIDVGNDGSTDWTMPVGSTTATLPVTISGSLPIRINTSTFAGNGSSSVSVAVEFWQAASTESYGSGCGQPLALTSNSPRLGTTWQLTTSGIDPVSPVAAVMFGDRGPAVPMTAIGLDAPGCDVHLGSLLSTLVGTNVGGSAMVSVTVPNTPTLVGFALAAQSICFTLANPAELLTSNGLAGTLGW